MARAGVKRRRNDRLLTNWLNPRPLRILHLFAMCTRICTRLADRRRHRRYCLHRSNLLMARPTRWIRDRVSCVFCIPIDAARRDRRRGPSDRGSITQEKEETRLRRSILPFRSRITDLFRTAICVDYPFVYRGRLSLRPIFDDNRSDEGNGLVSIYVTACTHASSVLVSPFRI